MQGIEVFRRSIARIANFGRHASKRSEGGMHRKEEAYLSYGHDR